MEWVLPSAVSSGEDTLFYYDYTGNVDSYFLQLIHDGDGGFTTNIRGDSYHGRVVAHYTAQNRSVGFARSMLGLADAGTYGCRHQYVFNPVANFTPVLFIYGK